MDERFEFLKETEVTCLPIKTTFDHRYPSASGLVEVEYWPSKDRSETRPGPPSHVILFILGNPGMPGYYTPFLDLLRSKLPPTFAIITTSHLGHSPSLPFPKTIIDLPGQLDTKLEFVRALRNSLDAWAAAATTTTTTMKEEGSIGNSVVETTTTKGNEAQDQVRGDRPSIILMGHSVGAWFTCEVMKEMKDDIQAGFLLFPTVGWIGDSWNGRALTPTIFTRPITSLLSFISPALRPILPITTFPKTTKSLLSSSTMIKTILTLARSEMELIREPDVEWFKSQGEEVFPSGPNRRGSGRGLYACYSANDMDGWVGKDGPFIRECLGGQGIRTKQLEGVPHGFCLLEKDWTIVANVIAEWVDPTIAQPKGEPGERTFASKFVPL